MPDREAVEKVRQEIMRFRELLDIMRQQLESGERAYDKLFASFTDEERQNTKEKDLQWKAAERMMDDLKPLRDAVLHMQFDSRELERAFEELYGIIITPEREE